MWHCKVAKLHIFMWCGHVGEPTIQKKDHPYDPLTTDHTSNCGPHLLDGLDIFCPVAGCDTSIDADRERARERERARAPEDAMAVKTATADPPIPNGYKISASILLVLDAVLVSLIIAYVPCKRPISPSITCIPIQLISCISLYLMGFCYWVLLQFQIQR